MDYWLFCKSGASSDGATVAPRRVTDSDRTEDEPSGVAVDRGRGEDCAIRLLGSPPLRRGPTVRGERRDVRAERRATYDRGSRDVF
jgi:hypothetical protein